MLELASEPLFVLAQLELRFRLRVGIEAVANLVKAGLPLLLLQASTWDEVTVLCWAQVRLCAHQQHFLLLSSSASDC